MSNTLLKAGAIAFTFLMAMHVVVNPALAADIGATENGQSVGASDLAGIVRYSTPGYAVEYGEGPGVFVHFESNESDQLGDWADSSDERDVKYWDNDSHYAVVAMPASHTGASFVDRTLGNGLLAQGWVDSIDVVQEVEFTDPVDDLADSDAWEKPGRWVTRLGYNDQFTSDGVGFSDDTNKTDLNDAINKTNPDESYTGSGVRVAVLDTGANTYDGRVFGNGTPGSTSRIVESKNFITNETGVSNVSDGSDSLHGTWVSAAIAGNHSDASFDGVAPNADLLVGKVLGDDGSGDLENVVRGIEWAKDNNADIISMSLGSQVYSPTVATEIKEFLDDGGKAVVIAAGNNRQTTRYITSPADVDQEGIITVAASSPEKANKSESMYFSAVGPDHGVDGSRLETRGAEPDIAAPGANITADIPTDSDSMENKTLSGTSMATPIVAGHLAAYLEAHPNADTSDVETYVESTASPMPDAGVTEVGAGMIDGTNLTAQSERDVDQIDERDDEATNRDAANRAFSNDQRGLFANIRNRVTG